MSVNTKMTAIADKIRSLRGVSGTMGLDAMATHLGNEITGLNAALAALTEKGVTVPDGTKVDGLAALIAAIEAGGDYGIFSEVFFGTYTPAEDTTQIINERLNYSPTQYIFAIAYEDQSGTLTSGHVRVGIETNGARICRGYGDTTDLYHPNTMSKKVTFGSPMPLQSGITYHYIYAKE